MDDTLSAKLGIVRGHALGAGSLANAENARLIGSLLHGRAVVCDRRHGSEEPAPEISDRRFSLGVGARLASRRGRPYEIETQRGAERAPYDLLKGDVSSRAFRAAGNAGREIMDMPRFSKILNSKPCEHPRVETLACEYGYLLSASGSTRPSLAA
jgi:hypothetical protein